MFHQRKSAFLGTKCWGSFAGRCGAALVLLVGVTSCWGDIIFIDNTFNPANYNITTYKSDPLLGISIQQIGGSALQILYALPTGSGDDMIGFVNPSFSYNPSTQGPIGTVSATASRYVQFLSPGFTLTANTWRPLIFQGGNYYEAVFDLPLVQGVYETGAALGLTASNFGLFDFTSGLFNSNVNPNFSSGLMEFGFASKFGYTVNTPVTVDVRYDPLVIDIAAAPVPEPGTFTFLLTAGIFTGLAKLIHRRRRSILMK